MSSIWSAGLLPGENAVIHSISLTAPLASTKSCVP
nr:MAG TPA: hypothetical protein [Caudoviricetes sp.]